MHARVYQYLGKKGVIIGAEVTFFVSEGQVGVQRIVFVTRLTNELVHLKGSLCNSSGAIPCEIPLAFAAVARRRAFFAQGDETWFVLVKPIHVSREGFLGEMWVSRPPCVGLGADVFVVFDFLLVVRI